MHRNYVGAVERASSPPSIVQADRLAGALGTTLSEMVAEVERFGSSPDPPPGSG